MVMELNQIWVQILCKDLIKFGFNTNFLLELFNASKEDAPKYPSAITPSPLSLISSQLPSLTQISRSTY